MFLCWSTERRSWEGYQSPHKAALKKAIKGHVGGPYRPRNHPRTATEMIATIMIIVMRGGRFGPFPGFFFLSPLFGFFALDPDVAFPGFSFFAFFDFGFLEFMCKPSGSLLQRAFGGKQSFHEECVGVSGFDRMDPAGKGRNVPGRIDGRLNFCLRRFSFHCIF